MGNTAPTMRARAVPPLLPPPPESVVICPTCSAALAPSSHIFRCFTCGQVMRVGGIHVVSVVNLGSRRIVRSTSDILALTLDARIRSLVDSLNPDDPSYMHSRNLLLNLPREPSGRIDVGSTCTCHRRARAHAPIVYIQMDALRRLITAQPQQSGTFAVQLAGLPVRTFER